MSTVTAFLGNRRLGSGPVEEIIPQLRALPPGAMPLVFDDSTGRVIDLDLRPGLATPGTAASPPRGRGRPRLGVAAREVTLLPRQWDWLASQPGGASAALRRLVAAAMAADPAPGRDPEPAYHFLAAIAGDLPGYEQALRHLFAQEAEAFAAAIAAWPDDIRDHALRLWPGRDPG